jgi:tRNA U55 pseudouridine synthase TruB
MYSAIKVLGSAFVQSCPRRQKLSAPPRQLTIRSLEMLSFEDRMQHSTSSAPRGPISGVFVRTSEIVLAAAPIFCD